MRKRLLTHPLSGASSAQSKDLASLPPCYTPRRMPLMPDYHTPQRGRTWTTIQALEVAAIFIPILTLPAYVFYAALLQDDLVFHDDGLSWHRAFRQAAFPATFIALTALVLPLILLRKTRKFRSRATFAAIASVIVLALIFYIACTA